MPCRHDDMTVTELHEDGYTDEVLLGCLCCQRDEINAYAAGVTEMHWTCGREDISPPQIISKIIAICNRLPDEDAK